MKLADEVVYLLRNTKKSTDWKVIYYSVITRGILIKISEDVYCFAPGNTTLTANIKNLQRTIDEIQLAAMKYNSNIQPLYNVFASGYAVKAVGIIKKADLLFPGLLELFGKAQFLGKNTDAVVWHSTFTGRIKS